MDEQQIFINNVPMARVRISRLQFRSIIGGVRVLLPVDVDFFPLIGPNQHWQQGRGIKMHAAIVAGPQDGELGVAIDPGGRPVEGVGRRQQTLQLTISNEAFRELVEIRQAQVKLPSQVMADVVFKVTLDVDAWVEYAPPTSAQVPSPPRHRESASPQQNVFTVSIPGSDWINIENQILPQKRILLEVELPPQQSVPSLQAAADRVAKASDEIRQGRFREAAGACREAFEHLQTALEETGKKWPQWFNTGAGQLTVKDEKRPLLHRFDVARYALHQLTHQARHAVPTAPAAAGTQTTAEVEVEAQYTRADAIAIVAMTAAMISHASATIASKS